MSGLRLDVLRQEPHTARCDAYYLHGLNPRHVDRRLAGCVLGHEDRLELGAQDFRFIYIYIYIYIYICIYLWPWLRDEPLGTFTVPICLVPLQCRAARYTWLFLSAALFGAGKVLSRSVRLRARAKSTTDIIS